MKLEDCDQDPHSQSNLQDFVVKHIDLEWDVDMEAHVLRGHATLRCEVKTAGVSELVLDTNGLTVHGVTVNGQSATFALGEAHAVFGRALRIAASGGLSSGQVVEVRVAYETSPESSGIQWLSPSQTEEKQHPYAFSQFQAIHARSAFPCQDSPSVKQTYSARVTVPKPLVALMSALRRGSQAVEGRANHAVYAFEQPVPIPSYLFAFAVGALVSQEIGPRTLVWSEAKRIAEVAWEFQETETFLQTAEEILTPYEFGQYDVLCLPGSFPYGGMENPCLTFVTPTLLAGDRSLSDVIAHEITHSWCGNLVTNRTWQHFWLNEGFTVFVERKIQQRLHGEAMRQFGYVMHNKDLRDSVAMFGEADKGFTSLVQDQSGRDPDDAFSSVPYERGAQFLFYLEHVVGGPAHFEPFLKAYIRKFRLQTLNSGEFKRFFLDYFKETLPKAEPIDWEAWFYGTGMPPVDMLALLDASLADRASSLAKSWDEQARTTSEAALEEAFRTNELEDWNSQQVIAFLAALLERTGEERPLPVHSLDYMARLYPQLERSKNAEIRFRWCMLNVQAGREAVYENATAFLGLVGRMKFVRPLYRALHRNPKSKELAVSTFQTHRSFYHNICSKMVARDLNL